MVANARAVIDFHSVVFVPHAARPAPRNINFAPVYAYVLRPSGDIPCSKLFASLRQDPDDREWPVEDGESYAISNKCVLTSQVLGLGRQGIPSMKVKILLNFKTNFTRSPSSG